MRKKALQVVLDVQEPSIVELSVEEKVQLDKLRPSQHGNLAERYGRLLAPGMATLNLEPGHYFFKTLCNASLKVIRGGVHTTVNATANDKDPWPKVPPAKGDEAPSEAPDFTVESYDSAAG